MRRIATRIAALSAAAATTAGLFLTALVMPAMAQAAPATSVSTVDSCSTAVAPGTNRCLAERRTDAAVAAGRTLAQGNRPMAASSGHAGYGPSDLRSAYALPAGTTTATVAIVDAYDNPRAESDLAAYRAYYGLPACTTANGCFRKVNQKGAASPLPQPNTGWAGEISLDLDMVSATCPTCHILLVETSDASSGLYTGITTAVSMGAKFVSLSWGGGETQYSSAYDRMYFNTPGVVYAVASGDSAYAGGLSYPASSPNVVSVGGTSLRPAATARGWTETAWKNTATKGAGSGCSKYEAKPSWQAGAVAASICAQRAYTDVSAVADPATGVAVYQTYGASGWAVYGGTSAAAPIIASVYALAGTPGGSDNPARYPYAQTAGLNDVTAGSTGSCRSALCNAGTGWDGPTGLGTPNGVAAFRAPAANAAAPVGTGSVPTSGGSAGGTAATTVAHTVTVPKPGEQVSRVGTGVSYRIRANDSAGDALRYTASGLPTGLHLDAATGLVTGTPTRSAHFLVTVSAADTTGASGSASFVWTVQVPSCNGQKIVNASFNSGSTGWTTSSGVLRMNPRLARTGKGYVSLATNARRLGSVSQRVALPNGCRATLTYHVKVTGAKSAKVHDKLTVTVNGHAVQVVTNRNRSSRYARRTIDLSRWAGKAVTIKWSLHRDGRLATTFAVDDATVTLKR